MTQLPTPDPESLRARYPEVFNRPISARLATPAMMLVASGIFIFALVAYPLPDVAKVAGYVATGVYLVTLALLVALVEWPEPTLRWAGLLLSHLPARISGPAGDWLRSFVSGLGVFHRPKLLIGSIALSVVVWVSYGLGLYFMWKAFDIHLPLTSAYAV